MTMIAKLLLVVPCYILLKNAICGNLIYIIRHPHWRDSLFRQTARKILSAGLHRLCNISLTPNDESFVQLRRHAILCLV